MKQKLFAGLVAAAAITGAYYAAAQEVSPNAREGNPNAQTVNPNQPNEHTTPGSGGISKPGVPGKAGGKAGATMSPQQGQSGNDQNQEAQKRETEQSGATSKPDTEGGQAPRSPER